MPSFQNFVYKYFLHLMSHVKVKKGGVTSQNFEIWHKLR